jgi:predicted secreted acid phosphatase
VTALTAALAAGTAGIATPGAVAATRAGVVADASTVTYASWQSDVAPIVAQAQAYLEKRVAAKASGEKPAIVLDIDNTSLASHFYQTTYPVPADPPLLALAKYAAAHGVSVFFVTGRPEIIDIATRYNLTTVGYTVDGLYSRDLGELLESLQTFKTAARKQIEADGYTITANIGNSASDLAGGYAEQTFKLPDYDGLLD